MAAARALHYNEDMNENQAILARHMIGMIRRYGDDADILEYLDSFATSLHYMNNLKGPIPWGDIASVCDQRYYSIKHGNKPIPLNTALLDECEKQIQPYLPKTRSV